MRTVATTEAVAKRTSSARPSPSSFRIPHSAFKLRPREHLGTPVAKQRINLALFSEVAPKYDFITRALSLGRDAAWKRHLIASLPASGRPVCVDLACGTGDLTRLLAARYPGGAVTGLDLTPAMLDIARARSAGQPIAFVEGTMNLLPFPDASVDIVTGGYALRNAPELDRAMEEIRRVLRPGGTAAFLDFSKPPSRFGQILGGAALKSWGSFWGLLLHGNADVYGYIADSLRGFPDREELHRRFRLLGFDVGHSRRFYAGLLECLVVTRRDP
jgi:ubiquinone/menaquinone biosynthesis methyltransferase